MQKRTIWFLLFLVILLFAYVGSRLLMVFYTDFLWFAQLGYRSVFTTIAWTKIIAFASFFTVFILLAGTNVWIARRYGLTTRVMPLEVVVGGEYPNFPDAARLQQWAWAGVVVGLGFFVAIAGIPVWSIALKYLNAVDFHIADPIFNRDIGFFVFNLPFYTYLQGWLQVVVLLTTLLVLASYYRDHSLRNDEKIWTSTHHVTAHISGLGAVYALLLAWGYRLKEYELLYSFRKSSFFGAGYTDLHVQYYAYRLLLVLAIVLAICLLYNLHFRQWRIPGYAATGYFVAILLFSWLCPVLYEQFIVKPNELKLETPYIQHAIDFTRKAYGLDRVEEVPFPGESNLTFEDIQNNLPTIRSIPLWDRRPLLDTYSQLQEIRTYYRFSGVDVDRYEVNGEYRQVMLAAREFSRSQLILQSDTWVNRHLVYTHGYGLVISPANQIVGEGLPSFFIQDIPPTSPVNMTVSRPEIYFGEGMRDYVVARSKTQEFDYPQGDDNVYTTYEGKGGVPINSFFRRLAFALRFGDPYLLFTNNLTSQSRILFDRHIGRRFGEEGPRRFLKLAPFLKFDSDPYLALVEGRMIWIQDAYTVTNMFPYAQPYGRPYVREMNYIRNSVKVVMDAYDGSVTFYAWDTQDPLIRAYMAIFPDLFQSAESISPALRTHLRYPIDLFEIQAKLYNTYHMIIPQVFYGREDAWETPTEYYGISDRPLTMSPYYVMVKLPDADREEYILMLPATPHDKPNMIGWLFARCDSPHYGQLQVYKLPKEKLIYGPMLVERRISQDTEVSREITLWDQRGSHVIRGNLLVIPIERSFIYVEPLYLRASQSGMPELKRVLVLHGETLAMGVNLEDALHQLFKTSALAKKPSATPGKAIDLKTLAQEALRQFEEAQEWLQSGNFLEYGQAVDQLKATLTQMTRQKEEKTNGP